MAEALRASFWFLSSVKPSPLAAGERTRGLLSCCEQSSAVAAKRNFWTNSERRAAGESGFASFAKLVVAYVGAGIATVAGSQITVQAKEVSRGNYQDMAAAEMRTAWHRTAATCYFLHEDSKRQPKMGDAKQEEASKWKNQDKCDLSDGWSTVNSHYFMDKKLDFHFHVESDAESQSKSLLEVAVDSGTTKSFQSSDWQTVDSPCASVSETKGSEKVVASDVTGKTSEELYHHAAKTNVTCSLLDSRVQQPFSSRKVEAMSQSVPRWRHANKGELAALIARKSSEDMGNCDLPPPLSPAVKGFGDQLRLGTQSLASSPLAFRSVGALDPKFKRTSVSQEVSMSSANEAQEDQRNEEAVNWKMLEGNSELLGEALCRSQTRAREAEKRAAEAISERDQLLRLFFREASVSMTYKHWVKYLQAENLWLRLRSGEVEEPDDDPMQEQQLIASNKRSKVVSQQQPQETVKLKKRKHPDYAHPSVAVLGCTVGLAFALGVGLAGAGLVFGCTMGWIMIAF